MPRLPFSNTAFVRVQTGIVASKNSLDNNKPGGEEGTHSARRCCFSESKVWLGVSSQVTHVYLGEINHILSIQGEDKGCLCLLLRPGERHTCRGLNPPPLTVVIGRYSGIKPRHMSAEVSQYWYCAEERGLEVSPCWRQPAQHLFMTRKSGHFLLRFDFSLSFLMRCSCVLHSV